MPMAPTKPRLRSSPPALHYRLVLRETASGKSPPDASEYLIPFPERNSSTLPDPFCLPAFPLFPAEVASHPEKTPALLNPTLIFSHRKREEEEKEKKASLSFLSHSSQYTPKSQTKELMRVARNLYFLFNSLSPRVSFEDFSAREQILEFSVDLHISTPTS